MASWSNPALKKLREAGLPVVMEGAYMEETPLGRAEWIKFTAAFFGQGRRGGFPFAVVDSAYQALAALAAQASARPTVVVNGSEGGLWWMPGGRSYVARFLADAGADYLWAGDTTRGCLNLDLEAVLARAAGAEFWLNPGDAGDLAALRQRDPRHAMFKAFRDGRVWNSDAVRCGAGNDFFETGLHPPRLDPGRSHRHLPSGAAPGPPLPLVPAAGGRMKPTRARAGTPALRWRALAPPSPAWPRCCPARGRGPFPGLGAHPGAGRGRRACWAGPWPIRSGRASSGRSACRAAWPPSWPARPWP